MGGGDPKLRNKCGDVLRIDGDEARGETDLVMVFLISGVGCGSLEPVEPFDAVDVDGDRASCISEILR